MDFLIKIIKKIIKLNNNIFSNITFPIFRILLIYLNIKLEQNSDQQVSFAFSNHFFIIKEYWDYKHLPILMLLK